MAKRRLERGQFRANGGRIYQSAPPFFNKHHIERLAQFIFERESGQHEYWQETGHERRDEFYRRAGAQLEYVFRPEIELGALTKAAAKDEAPPAGVRRELESGEDGESPKGD